MHVFMMTHDDVIDKYTAVYLQCLFDNEKLKLALEAEWNRLSQDFIKKSIDEWR